MLEQLEAVIAEYIQACESGLKPDRNALLRQHPQLAEDLRAFFASRDRVESLAAPMRAENGRQERPLVKNRCFGDYELEEEIARGGMGVVYKARQKSLGRTVAVKMILGGALATEDDVKRFREEAMAAACLNHSGIVAVHEVGQHEGRHYFSMDFVDGPSLAEMTKDAPLPARRCAELVRDIARAVHAAHQQGVLHRDLKPSNVLLDEAGHVRITDFGLAKRVESDSDLTATGQVLGTPAYMCPEQAAGLKQSIGPASDVYSLGVILYELLTGRPPIRGETPVETLLQVQTVEPVSPRRLNAKVPRELETISLKCLEKEPAKRYASALHLAHDLERFLAGEPILAHPVSRVEHGWRWCRRHPLAAGLLATVVLLLAAVTGIAIGAYFRESYLRQVAQNQEIERNREKVRAEGALAKLSLEREKSRQLVGDVTTLETERDALTRRNAEVRRSYYDDLLELAGTQWEAGNAVLAVEYLEQCPKELRDEQWERLKAHYSHEFMRLPGGRMVVRPQQDLMAVSGDEPSKVTLWRLPECEIVRTLRGPSGDIAALAISFDGGTLAAAGEDGWIRLWNVESGEELGDITAPKRIATLAFSADDKQIVAALRLPDEPDPRDPGTVTAWSVKTRERVCTYPGWQLAAFGPQGRYLATGKFERRVRYDGQKYDVHKTQFWDPSVSEEHQRQPLFIVGDTWNAAPAFGPLPGTIAVLDSEGGYGNSARISILDADTRRPRRSINPGFYITAFCLSRDGARIAYGIGGEFVINHSQSRFRKNYRIVVWNLRQNREELVLPWQEHAITEMAFLYGGTRLATADGESVKLWNVARPRDPIEVIRADTAELDVRPGDSPMWGGSRAHVNTRDGRNIPAYWNPGDFDRQTGAWLKDSAVNIKWVARLGSQSYGNAVVANGRVFVGTNNGAGHVKRYPPEIDLGVLLCLDEQTGKFLWQHSNEKLSTGRVHDWPLQGVCSTPTVDGNRLWYVSNRGEVVCLDTEGFYDGEDDGPVTSEWMRMNEVDLTSVGQRALLEEFARRKIALPEHRAFATVKSDHWVLRTWNVEVTERRPVYKYIPLYDVRRDGSQLHVRPVADAAESGSADLEPEVVFTIDDPLLAPLDKLLLPPCLLDDLRARSVELAAETPLKVEGPDQKWSFESQVDGRLRRFELRRQSDRFSVFMQSTVQDLYEADVVWRFNMMTELGVSQHNMANCSVMTVGDKLFVCTSNGLDETHINLPAPDAPSFMAMNRNTGEVLWTDKSPGRNILHAQWASPSYGVFKGQPQVIFPGGDGWLYSFDPEGDGQGGAKLLWKFDCNPKESIWVLGGRGTRNNLIAFPAIYDGLVYIATGHDPEHGEGKGHLWCIDPTRHTDGSDVSAELAVNLEKKIIPHRRIQAVDVSKGERAIPNPKSAEVWHYTGQDLNGDGKLEFEEEFHRSICIPAIKDDILYIADFSGLFHCLHAKTGELLWTYDMLAACWSSPLLVDGKIYIGDEDGDITIFGHSPDPRLARRQAFGAGDSAGWRFIQEINMGNSVYMTPIVANDVLYIANKTHLFAIVHDPGPRAAPR